MPKQRTPKARRESLPLAVLHYLKHGDYRAAIQADPTMNRVKLLRLTAYWNVHQLRDVWLSAKDDLLAEWIRLSPGSRPWAWWKFDASEAQRPESEAAYLSRHGLLTAAERKRIAIEA